MTDVASPNADPLAPWPDDVVWRPVSGKLILVEQVRLAALAGTAVVAGAVLWTFFDGLWGWAAAAVAVLWAARAAVVVRSVRSWGYAERPDDLLVRHGLLVRRLSIVPYARMQFVDVSAGPLERSLGLATVELHTAAAASDARIPGLPGPEAARLRDRLSALGETHAEGL
ncbi:membrane protein [Virgisporangium aliadipatigenens]|uniref:Membrane protein n=1 Tax=Virgisporangium aliadipatigenens TaxID=741659 RepID=A0A8J4DS51_9ACTN|nr:PH domain-containing protein [Virgisporangium aliadipatigenens]GIJ47488.1 membrane protein [Virgisporangium aliadipatigenens]